MSGSKKFHVELSTDFEARLDSFFKRYYKHNRQARETFEGLLGDILDSLESNPRDTSPPITQTSAHLEQWPKKIFQEHLELWKFYFRLPGYSGDAGQGRIMYLFEPQRDLVCPFLIYTHDEHTKRPSDDQIRRVLRRYLDSREPQ